MPFQHLAVDKSMADWWMSYKLIYIYIYMYIFASFVDGCASVNASCELGTGTSQQNPRWATLAQIVRFLASNNAHVVILHVLQHAT